MNATQFPCRCVVTSHQYHSKGWCHAVGIVRSTGKPFALIEADNGELQVQYLHEAYTVKLEK